MATNYSEVGGNDKASTGRQPDGDRMPTGYRPDGEGGVERAARAWSDECRRQNEISHG